MGFVLSNGRIRLMVTEELKDRYKKLLKESMKFFKKVDKKYTWVNIGFMIFGGIIGLVIAAFAIMADIEGTLNIDNFMIFLVVGLLVILLIMYPLQIIIHEAGHLIFGLATGYKFLSFRIWSLIFYKKDGKIIRKKYSVKGTAGQCLMYPPKRNSDGSYPYVLYNLGGGLNNLIFSVPFIIPTIISNNFVVQVLCGLWVFIGVLTALTNIIPLTIGVQNDGMNLKSMIKDKVMEDAFYLQLQVNAQMSDGKRITEYPTETFALPEGADNTNMLTAFADLYGYYQQLTFHNLDEAEQRLRKMEEQLTSYKLATMNMILLERLFFNVLQHKPLEEIAVLYKRYHMVIQISKTNISMQRIRYIYETYLSEEDKRDIITLIKKKKPKKWKKINKEKLYDDFLKTAMDFPVAGEADMFVDIVEYLKSKNNEETDINLNL